jgi:superfamily II DNA/RNA helicase
MITVKDFFKMSELLSFDDNWELSKYASSVVDTSEGRQIIIHVLDIWDYIHAEAKPIWLDLIERAGFYPYYMSKINKGQEIGYEISAQASIRTQYFKSSYLPDIYFHEQQKEIELALSSGVNIAVSAPTSFGKSLLIEEIVARKKFDNILIIQPTLALIDETRKRMTSYNDYYNLVVNTRQTAQEKNIFILTAERVLEYEDLPKINFFIIDEFYKISHRRDDSRIDALNVTLLKVMKQKPQAMFLTPTVDSLSQKFQDKYDVSFFKTDYALVNTAIEEIRTQNRTLLAGDNKKKKLFELLEKQTEPSIVYVKSPKEAYKLALEYLDYLGETKKNINSDLDIFEWMDKYISPQWQLKELLKYGIGAHNGALPRHIVTSEIELFNTGVLNVLFATVSLIEGVNTAAKNMIVFSQNKGKKRIDFFDFANIIGRAGRMNKHFTGKVYLFIEEPMKEAFTIDVPAVDQKEVSDEIVVNISDSDVVDKERKARLNAGLDDELKEIIKANLISVEGQKALYVYLKERVHGLDYLKWKKIPKYEQLRQTLYLGYRFLKGNENEKFAARQAIMALQIVNMSLTELIFEQAKRNKSKNKKNPINNAINDVLKFQRTEAGFQIPKLLAVIESLQKHAFQKAGIESYGDYSLFAAMLENEQVDERFQFLIDYGVPSSAIKKISAKVDQSVSGDYEIIKYIQTNRQIIYPLLLPYEKKLLSNAISD